MICHIEHRTALISDANARGDGPVAIVIDTETTGLDDGAGIVSIGVCLIHADGHRDSMQVLCHPRPGCVIESQALAINGYSQPIWRQRGAVDEATAIASLRRLITAWPSAALYAHNASFDRRMVATAATAAGLDLPPAKRWRCTRDLARHLLDARGLTDTSASLRSACPALGLPGPEEGPNGEHQAAADAYAAAGLVILGLTLLGRPI